MTRPLFHSSLLFLVLLIESISARAQNPECSYEAKSHLLSIHLQNEQVINPSGPYSTASPGTNHLWHAIKTSVSHIHKSDEDRMRTAREIYNIHWYPHFYRDILEGLSDQPELDKWLGRRPTVHSVQEEQEYIFDLYLYLLSAVFYKGDRLKHKRLMKDMKLDQDNWWWVWNTDCRCRHFWKLMNDTLPPDEKPYQLLVLENLENVLTFLSKKQLMTPSQETAAMTLTMILVVNARRLGWR